MPVQLKCADHPKYKATYPPRVECITCWKIYATKLRKKLSEQKAKK